MFIFTPGSRLRTARGGPRQPSRRPAAAAAAATCPPRTASSAARGAHNLNLDAALQLDGGFPLHLTVEDGASVLGSLNSRERVKRPRGLTRGRARARAHTRERVPRDLAAISPIHRDTERVCSGAGLKEFDI